jgi:hypothetical protein
MRNPRLGLSLFAFASSLAACNAAVDPIDVKAGCPQQPLRGPEQFAPASPQSVIDDFENGDLLLPRTAGRSGSWYPFPVMAAAAEGVASMDCAAHGLWSGHFTATGAADGAVNWNTTMIDPFTAVIPYDASAWSGFSFWIAAGASVDSPMVTSVGVTTTDVLDAGGVCTACNDYHLVPDIPLTRTWTRWSFRFDELAQKGFGLPQVPLRKDRLVNFIFWPKQVDFWIDDFRFEP